MIARRSDPVEIARVVAAQATRIRQAFVSADMPIFRPVMKAVSAPPSPAIKRVLVSEVIGWVAFEMGVARVDILSRCNEHRCARARQAVVWVAVHALGQSRAAIASAMGSKDHSTATSQLRRAEKLRERDPAFLAVTDKLVARALETAR